MTHDPKLVEVVARALWDDHEQRHDLEVKEPWEEAGEDWQAVYRKDAATALAAMSASGEWWVAPWEATSKMEIAADELESSVSYFDWIVMWAAMRDAHLKDTGTGS